MTTDEHSNEVLLEAPVTEQTVEAPTPFDGLSNRDALAKSMEMHREGTAATQDGTPTKKEVVEAVQAEVDAPSEFSGEGKRAWVSKDITGIQKEFRRIHDSRTQEITRAQHSERQAREEGKTYREMAKMAAPYIEARGNDGVTPEKAIMEALALVSEFKKADSRTIKAELRKIGIDLDKSDDEPTQRAITPEIEALQNTVNELKKDKEDQQFQKTAQTFGQIFDQLTSQKTRTGETVFPDLLDDSDTGISFARELGSLTQDQRFQAGVLRRFPSADLSIVVREAYKYLGGKVSGEAVSVSTQQNKQHLDKSRRATAATPGRIAPRANDSNLNGKLSSRAALEKAIEIHSRD